MVKKSNKKINNETSKETSQSKLNESNLKFDFNLLKKIIPIILILFAMFIAFDIRSGAIELNNIEENVRANVHSQIQNLLMQQIDSQYPNINPTYKQEMFEKEYLKVLDTGVLEFGGQSVVIEDLVKENSNTLKAAFKDDNGQTYLTAIDPYFFYRESLNYYFNGHTGDTLKENESGDLVPYTSLRVAPVGRTATYNPEFQTWISAFMYKIFGINEQSSHGEKMKAIYLLPVIFSMLAVIPAFFLIRRFSNDLVALFGALLLVSISTFVSRTTAGFVDTEPYGVVFPLFIVASFVFAVLNIHKIKYSLIYSIIAGLFMGLGMWSWNSMWFIFVFALMAIVSYLGYLLLINIINKEKTTQTKYEFLSYTYVFLSFITSSILFTYIFAKENILLASYNGIFSQTSGIVGFGSNIWPNVFSSVAELAPATFSQILSSLGGKLIFLLAMLGIFFLILDFKAQKYQLYKTILIFLGALWFLLIIFGEFFVSLSINNKLLFLILLFLPIGFAMILSLFNKNKSPKVFLAIMTSIWLAGTLYMSFSGVRFIMLLAAPIGIAFAFGLFYIYNTINNFFIKEFSIQKPFKKFIAGSIVVIILFGIVYAPVYKTANQISNNSIPNFDDAWFESMQKIKNNSKEDAIITSWWDFGHFFAAIAQRGVTFDGGSQTLPQSHWVGKLLLENDENVSVDILRMLVCGGNMAHDTMLSFTDGNDSDGVKINKIIYETLGKDNVQTRSIIENNKYYTFNSNQIDEIMNYLSCENPVENFLITSEDMVGKAGVWAHWGLWDFNKKYVHDNYKTKSTQQIATEIDEDINLIQIYVDELREIDQRARNENIKRADLINRWFADYPSYIPLENQYTYNCEKSENNIACANSININLENMQVTSGFDESIKFKNLVIPINGSLNVTKIDSQGNVDIILIETNGKYSVMLAQNPLGGSTFTKLFYLNGIESQHFELIDSRGSATGNTIKVWKVKWD